jgi:glycosyltransferase involved in cell wall biosynthesis
VRRIRICRVIARLNVGGAAKHVIQLTAGLDSQRFDQMVVTGVESPGEASALPEARRAGLSPVVIPELGREVSAKDDVAALFTLYRLFRQWRPDIVETHTAKAGTLGRIAALLAGVPVRIHVFHGHVFHSYFSPRKTQVFLGIERALARISTRIIVLDEEQRREILGYGVGTPQNVVSIPLGFDLAPFLAAQRGVGTLRAELGLPPDAQAAPIVGTVGRLFAIKAHEVFLEAAAQILAARPGAHFAITGEGEREAELKALAGRLLPPGSVHFLGNRAVVEMPGIYADYDLFTLTSDNEGTPVTIIEAMAAGCPVVSTDVGGVRSLVQDETTGLLVPRRDPAALAGACLRLLDDPARREQMGIAARAAVYPRLDLSTLVTTMTRFYTDLVEPRLAREPAHSGQPRRL